MSIQVTCTCGKQCEFGDEFAGWLAKCPACGRAVAVPRTGAGIGPGAQFPAAPRPRRKRRTALLVILGAAGLVVVAGILVAAFFLPGGPESREGGPESRPGRQSESVIACFEEVLAFDMPGSGSKPAGKLHAGDEVKILGMEKGQVNVSTKDLGNVWVSRLYLCLASEFQKFKADGNIPKALAFMTAKDGQLSLVGGAMSIRNGYFALTDGLAICLDDETLGQRLNLAGTSIVSRPDTLYVCCKGGSIRELKILPAGPESREGGQPSSAAAQPRAAAPQPKSAPESQPPQPTRIIPREQELQALRLLGNYTGNFSLSATIDSGPLDRDDDITFLECGTDTAHTLRTDRWPESFRRAAEHVAASKLKRHAYLTVFVSAFAFADSADILRILGQPEATERKGFFRAAVPGNAFEPASARPAAIIDTAGPGTVPLVWYQYGWLAFGVADDNGKVVAVRGDCRNIPAAAPAK